MPRFTQSSNIFQDEDVLTDDYRPNEILERDDEIADYEEALQPIANGASPRSTLVYGQTGTGKTISSKIILNDLKRDSQAWDGINVEVVWLNCKDMTSYQAAIGLVNQFREPDNQVSSSGKPRAEIHKFLWEEIEEADATHLVFVLDEIDSFGTDDELLYQIPRAFSNDKVENTKVGVVGISNNFKYTENLSARVKSSLCEQDVHFDPYDANQLRNILRPRAEKAFEDGVLTNDVIPLAAANAGNTTGSARHALDILYKAGSLARKYDDDEVTEDHVREAMDEVERDIIRDELEELPTQSHIVLYVLTLLHRQNETPVRKKELYKVYKAIAKKIDVTVKSERTIHEQLGELSLKGFLEATEKNEGPHGGRHYQYELDVDLELVLDVLSNDTRAKEAMDLQLL